MKMPKINSILLTLGQHNVKGAYKLKIKEGHRYYNMGGTPGSGAGKGGGAGGTIKEAGGALGKLGAAQEEGYFFQKDRKKLEKLKKQLKTGEEAKPEAKK